MGYSYSVYEVIHIINLMSFRFAKPINWRWWCTTITTWYLSTPAKLGWWTASRCCEIYIRILHPVCIYGLQLKGQPQPFPCKMQKLDPMLIKYLLFHLWLLVSKVWRSPRSNHGCHDSFFSGMSHCIILQRKRHKFLSDIPHVTLDTPLNWSHHLDYNPWMKNSVTIKSITFWSASRPAWAFFMGKGRGCPFNGWL